MSITASDYPKLSQEGVFEAYRAYIRPSYQEFYDAIGYEFTDLSYLIIAFTHTSFSYEQIGKELLDNERLEFLGDAILEFVVSTWLFQRRPKLNEGKMTSFRAITVREETLAMAAKNINLGDYLLFGHGEAMNGGKNKASNLSNAFEALLAAVYLDFNAGLPVHDDDSFVLPKELYNVYIRLLEPYLQKAVSGKLIYDYKSKLIEKIQENYETGDISFVLEKQEGPAHCPTFTVAVKLLDRVLGHGAGSSKKEAEQNASKQALEVLS